jgi:hypothetical protein
MRFAEPFGVIVDVFHYEKDKRRADVSYFGGAKRRLGLVEHNTPQQWRYELTYLPHELDDMFVFLCWLIESRARGTSLYTGPAVNLLVPHRPDIVPTSLECRYAWTSDAWSKRCGFPETAKR